MKGENLQYQLTKEQTELVRAFRAFGEREFTSEKVAQWCRDQGLPDEVTRDLAKLYFDMSTLDQQEPSGSYSLFSQALIIQELSRCAAATLPFQNDLFSLHIIREFAANDEALTVVDDFRKRGRLMFALAISEPNVGSDTKNIQTNTRTVEGKLLLNGQKTFVNNGEYAPYILVAAIDKDNDCKDLPVLEFWLVPRTLPGIKAVPIGKIGQSLLPFASISFRDVELKPSYRLNGSPGGFKQLFQILEYGRVIVCAASLGLAQAAMKDAVEFAQQREAFGKRIASFQQVEQMLTDMEIKLQNMSTLLYRAAWEVDNATEDRRLSVALMKRYVPQAATEVASDAIQILGGRGYREDCRVGRIWQDCRGNQIAEGTDQIMVYIAAPRIIQRYTSSSAPL
jgi:alkylation response protein AidB-like acyl-CoA dehydrogenase